MIKYKKLLIIFVLGLLLGFPGQAYAGDYSAPKLEDKVIFGGTFSLYEGEHIEGSLVIIGGNLEMEVGSLVDQDVVLLASTATISGEIGHDVIGIGGVISLTDTAVVYGDLVAPGSVLNRDSEALVEGQVITQGSTVSIDVPEFARVEVLSTPPAVFNAFGNAAAPALGFLWFAFRVVAFSTVAVLMIAFIPQNTQRTRVAMINYPVLSGGLGLLTLFASIPLVIIFALTLVAATLSALLWGGVGWILGITIGAIGLGAVMLTRFGTQDYVSPRNQVEASSKSE